jgi:hypothetical protein
MRRYYMTRFPRDETQQKTNVNHIFALRWAKMYILLGAERWNTRSKLVHRPGEPPHHLSMLHSATSSSFTVCLEK